MAEQSWGRGEGWEWWLAWEHGSLLKVTPGSRFAGEKILSFIIIFFLMWTVFKDVFEFITTVLWCFGFLAVKHVGSQLHRPGMKPAPHGLGGSTLITGLPGKSLITIPDFSRSAQSNTQGDQIQTKSDQDYICSLGAGSCRPYLWWICFFPRGPD